MATDQTGTVRIFVGGVGENVSKDDLEKIFSQRSMGKVEHVDFVRTKGRSFAYVDFSPTDDHSLSKLLSMYNGCLWKGGKLKLEKAKEHYMARLKREWSEDAESESSNLVDLDGKIVSSEHDKKVSDTKQLHMFFPRLGKIKSIPFSGTGKHKYSFQRIDVPALPVHFCDCEEHNLPSPLKKISAPAHYDVNKSFDDPEEGQGGGMNEDEVNIMTSVMNKLMHRESNSNAKKSGTELTQSGYDSNKPMNGLQDDNKADSEGDEDNLIINITKREDSISTSTRGRERKPTSEKKRPRSDWMESSLDGQQHDSSKAQRSDISSKLKTKVTHPKGDESEVASNSMGGKETGPDKLLTTGHLWSQKSSWKELVGTKGMGFSISHVLSVKASSKECQPQPNTSAASKSTDHKSSKLKESDNLVEDQTEGSDNSLEYQMEESDNLLEDGIEESDNLSEDQLEESNNLSEDQLEKSDNLSEDQLEESDNLSEDQNEESDNISEDQLEKSGNISEDQLEESDNISEDENEESENMSKDQNEESDNLSEEDQIKESNNISEDHNEVSDNYSEDQNEVSDYLSEDQDEVSGSHSEDQVKESDSHSEDQVEESNSLLEGQRKNNNSLVEPLSVNSVASSEKSGRGASWRQKSSWTQLVNQDSGVFSISQILPNTNFEKLGESESKSTDVAKSELSENNGLVKQEQTNVVQGSVGNFKNLKEESPRSKLGFWNEGHGPAASNSKITPGQADGKKSSSLASASSAPAKKTTFGGDTCTFMRNAASLKEWEKSKASLSGSRKKKSKEH